MFWCVLVVELDICIGIIQDVQYVVILMQENCSFDYYFGYFNGVCGFNDFCVFKCQDGKLVWYQNYKYEFFFYYWDIKVISVQWVSLQNYEWLVFYVIWNQGCNDKWMVVQYFEVMGYFKCGDIFYYYVLVDVFILCEVYYQLMMGLINLNCFYYMSGCVVFSGDGKDVYIGNDMGDGIIGVSGMVDWIIYFEWLSVVGVDWWVYQEGGYCFLLFWYLYVDVYWKYWFQEQNNYDCNVFVWFRNFKNVLCDLDFWQCVMFVCGVDQLCKDVQENMLLQVLWIVVFYCYCEYFWWGFLFGEYYVIWVFEVLISNFEVWVRIVFIFNYDEGDGFYDYVSVLVLLWKDGVGFFMVSIVGEIEVFSGLFIGFGYCVLLIVILFWLKGGKVSVEVFDYILVLCFFECCFGVVEENILFWWCVVCGDLILLFDFQGVGDIQVVFDLINVLQSDVCKEDVYWQQFYWFSFKYWFYEFKSLFGQEKGQCFIFVVFYQLYVMLVFDIVVGKLCLILGNDGMSLLGNLQGYFVVVFQVQLWEVGNLCFYIVISYLVVQESGEELGWIFNDEFDDLFDVNGCYVFEVYGFNGFFCEFYGNLYFVVQMVWFEVLVIY